ncbi:OmpH family outer membrane protein [Kushneria aurantia]|uniref:OmpH family outer membrane protein n=1 Tax=Kushneria aurantia TaxID=504092 RepID=A0ABV6G544_9GAMM|nr:OmpH family outer membrane protein [Kushneria aurantia]
MSGAFARLATVRRAALVMALLCASVIATEIRANEVAVLDWRQALMDTDQAQRSLDQLKSRLSDQQRQVRALADEVQSLQKRLERDGDTMSDAERQALVSELRDKGSRFQRQRGRLEQARDEQEQAFLEQARPKLDRAIKQVVEHHNIDVLVDRDSVIYAGESLDMTREVTSTFNSLN